MPESKYSIGGIKNGISILFFYYERGVTNAKYRTTDRFRNSSYADEEICKLSTKKKDERVSWVCWIFPEQVVMENTF